jgi:hypothetical protein
LKQILMLKFTYKVPGLHPVEFTLEGFFEQSLNI